MVTVKRLDFKRYCFESPIPRELKKCKESLRIFQEGSIYSKLYQEDKWDGYHKFYDFKNTFDVGLLDELIDNLKKLKISYRIVEEYVNPVQIKDFVLNPKLAQHQKEGVEAFFSRNLGIMMIPTRGGKTFVSGEIVKLIIENNPKCTILFYVDTTDLFTQTVEELAKYLKIQERAVGTINSFGINLKQFTVAMIQTVTSIYNRKKPEAKILTKYFAKLDCLIVDEIQEYTSPNRVGLLKKCRNINFLLGLSATPFKDVTEANIISNLTTKGFFGGIVYEVGIDTLQERGWLALDKIMLITHEHRKKVKLTEEDSGIHKYHKFLKNLIHENKDRNMILLDIINMCKRNKWKTLMIFNSKEHGHLIKELSDCDFISGDDNQKVRNIAKDKFLRGRGKVLLASNIYKKGITLPEVEILVIADGGLEGSSIIQKKGRVLGAVENKTRAITIDIMDIEKNYFSDHSTNRLEVYVESVGDERVEVYEETDLLMLEESIKEWFDEE